MASNGREINCDVSSASSAAQCCKEEKAILLARQLRKQVLK